MEDNLNPGEKMGGLFHILMELIFRLEWPSPIIVAFSAAEEEGGEEGEVGETGAGGKSGSVSEKRFGPV